MESSALAAVAQFRNVDIFIFFYAADELSKNKWNKRCLGNKELDNKTYLAILALKLGVEIMKEKI